MRALITHLPAAAAQIQVGCTAPGGVGGGPLQVRCLLSSDQTFGSCIEPTHREVVTECSISFYCCYLA
jgi:hypothetical protein